MKIAIYENALAQIVTSAVDAFPKECFGQLLGKKYNSTFKLNSAYNMYSSLRRTENSISYSLPRLERLEKILEKICGEDTPVLGTYHSHPNKDAELSDKDKKRELKNENLQIVISIKRTKSAKNYLRRSRNKNNLLGVINYHLFEIAGFYYDKNEKKFQEAHFDPLPKNLVYRMRT